MKERTITLPLRKTCKGCEFVKVHPDKPHSEEMTCAGLPSNIVVGMFRMKPPPEKSYIDWCARHEKCPLEKMGTPAKASDVKLDHVYVSVENLGRAVEFYETLLGTKVSYRSKSGRWADFCAGSECYFALTAPDVVGDKRVLGNNSIPVFISKSIDDTIEKIKEFKIEVIEEPHDLESARIAGYYYRSAYIKDTEGNIIELAQYDRNRNDIKGNL